MAKRSKKTTAAPVWWSGDWFLGFVLLVIVGLVYSPVCWAGYIWDDDLVVTANPVVIGPLGLKEIWTTRAADICPLTITTFWAEHKLWSLAPLPYHLVNVLFHAATAITLWLVLRSLRIPGAWVGAALWALHPVMVESVAWITEMKNTESGFFFLLSIFFFVRYVRANAGRDYGLTLLFAAMAMASKSSTVILPLVLVLVAWWMEGRWNWRRVVAVSPMLVMAMASGVLSIWKQRLEGSDDPDMARSWLERLAGAGDAVWFYLGKLVWPHPLVMIYPRWQIDAGAVISYLPLVAVIVILVVLWLMRRAWGRGWFFSFAYFVVALLPVLGFINLKFFYYSLVADHFQYLAAMGPLALAGAGIFKLTELVRAEKVWMPVTACGVVLLGAGLLSWQKTWVYGNELTLWADTLKENPLCAVAYNNIGMVHVRAHRIDDAMPYFQKALEVDPKYESAESNIGNALLERGDSDGAITHFQNGLALKPGSASIETNLGVALARTGRRDEAIAHFRRALELEPENAMAGSTLGMVYVQKGMLDEALAQLKTSVELNPYDVRLRNNYGGALIESGRVEEGIVQLEEALRLKPDDANARQNLELAQTKVGKP